MRIAYVCGDSGVPVFGCKGCSVHVQAVLAGLVRHGADVDLFARRLGGEAPPELCAVRVHRLPHRVGSSVADRERHSLAGNARVQQFLLRAGRFDLVYERYSLWQHAAMEYAQRSGTPGLLEVNAPLIDEQARYRELVDRGAAERSTVRSFRAAKAILAVSEELVSQIEQVPEARGRVHVVSNGVNPDRFRGPRTVSDGANHGGSRPFTVGFVGTLKPWHGLQTLLDAFISLRRRRPGARLLLVGDGPERARLEARLTRAGESLRSAVTWTGAVAPSDVPQFLAAMDVAVAPYPRVEGFYYSPLKIYEYMAAGLPTVASDIGQIEHLIAHERHGLLCRPGDSGDLFRALDRLWRDVTFRRRLGRAARQRVLRSHTWGHRVRRIFELAGCEPPLPAAAALGVVA